MSDVQTAGAERLDVYGLDAEGLKSLVARCGQKPYRARQLHEWLYGRLVGDFEAMTDLPAPFRAELMRVARVGSLEVAAEQTSTDGTVKRLYRLGDGQLIESVLMAYESARRTACISSQAGCAMGCVFCATGQMGFARHLRPEEIVGQAMYFARDLASKGERLSNVVLMGMGEPFHNYDHVVEAVRRLIGDLKIGARHITISTVGLVPQIRRFAEEGLQVTLAVSLHNVVDVQRDKIMPVNRRFPVGELLEACRYYVERTRRRVSFEWALIEGVNDTPEQARQLGAHLQGLLCHVNLIPLNPTAGFEGGPSGMARCEAFVRELAAFGVPATVRVRRGIDIDAGCGQLKSAVLRKAGRGASSACFEDGQMTEKG